MKTNNNMNQIPQNIINKIYGYIKNNRIEKCLEQIKYYKKKYDIERIYYYGNYCNYMNCQDQKHFFHYVFDQQRKNIQNNQIHFIKNTNCISIG